MRVRFRVLVVAMLVTVVEYSAAPLRAENASGYAIKITSPAPGVVLTSPQVIVRGEVTMPKNQGEIVLVRGALPDDIVKALEAIEKTGDAKTRLQLLAMSGQLALVEGSQFAALTMLREGTNTITASAGPIDHAAATAEISVSVPRIEREPSVMLEATPAAGPFPLSVKFDVRAIGAPYAATGIDFDGDGAIDMRGNSKEWSHIYDKAGLFFPVVIGLGKSGETRATTLVHAFAPPDLVRSWNEMKAALRRGDIDGALQYFAADSRAQYAAMFRALTVEHSKIDSVLTELRVVKINAGDAECEMLREEQGKKLSHLVRFVRDYDGVWRIRFL